MPESKETQGAPDAALKYQELERKLKETEDKASKFEETSKKFESGYKDLSVRLTKNQQELAELYRFHKATIPKLNKSFAEDWDDDPEGAVVKRVDTKMAPIAQKADEIGTEMGRMKAQMALQTLLIRYPHWASYVDKVRELGEEQEYADLTWKGEKGIKALFLLAGAQENAKTKEKEEEKQEGETEIVVTEKNYTEGSSGKNNGSNGKVKLNPDELLIARKLGVKPEDYYKHKHMETE